MTFRQERPARKTSPYRSCKKKPLPFGNGFSRIKSLAVSYSHRRVSDGRRNAARQSTALPGANAARVQPSGRTLSVAKGPTHQTSVGAPHKKSRNSSSCGFDFKSLAVSYSHMGRPHTTIGAERFHFRVRKGIGWFPLAIAARKTGLPLAIWIFLTKLELSSCRIKYMSY